MTNDFSTISAESNLRDEMTVASNEPSLRNPAYDGPMGIFEGMDDDKEPSWVDDVIEMAKADNAEANIDSHLEADYEDRQNGGGEDETVDAGWPGDGSGTDDFADYISLLYHHNETTDQYLSRNFRQQCRRPFVLQIDGEEHPSSGEGWSICQDVS